MTAARCFFALCAVLLLAGAYSARQLSLAAEGLAADCWWLASVLSVLCGLSMAAMGAMKDLPDEDDSKP